jgi:hypothetical protein
MTAFGADVLRLTIDLLPLLLAFALVRLVRSAAHAALVVLTALVDPDYRFGALLLPRLLASGLQLGIAFAGLLLWRQWRAWTESVTVH